MRRLILTIASVAVATSGCVVNSGPSTTTAVVHVNAPPGGCWSGAMGNSTRDGCGPDDVQISNPDGIFVANAQKQDDGPWRLTLTLEVSGQQADEADTTAAYGLAQVEGRG